MKLISMENCVDKHPEEQETCILPVPSHFTPPLWSSRAALNLEVNWLGKGDIF